MFVIGHNSYIESGYIISTSYDEPTLAITISQLESMYQTQTYTWRLYSRYQGQDQDLIEDAIFMYERDNHIVK